MNFRAVTKKGTKQNRYAVALGRVSSEDQKRRGVSLDAQKNNIGKWAAENNVTILKEAYFDHSAFRGLDEEEEFLDLIEYAKADRRVSLFLVDEKSRFARSRYTRIVKEEELRRSGVKLFAINEPNYDVRTVHGIWMDGISITKNEALSVEIAYHVRKGMTENAESRDHVTGWCFKNGGMAPDGYLNTRVVRSKDARGKDIVKLLWELDQERKDIVRYIVLNLWLARGMSWNAIRDHLNSHEPKWHGQHTPLLSKKGTTWGGTSVREVCIKALEGVYSGIYYWNRTGRDMRGTGQKWKDESDWKVVENAHPQIITIEEWEELKRVRGPEIMQRHGRGNNDPRAANSRWLLSGKNALGDPFFVCLNGSEDKPHHLSSYQIAKNEWYMCSMYQNRGKAGCDKPFYVDKVFEDTVFEEIMEKFTEDNIKELVRSVNQGLQDEIRDITAAKNHLLKQIANIEKEIKGLMSTLADASDRTKKLLLAQIDGLAEQKEELEKELISLEKEQPQVKLLDEAAILSYMEKARETWETGSNAAKREFLRRFVCNLELDPEEGIVYINFFTDPTRTSPVDIKKKPDSTGLIISGMKHARSPAPFKTFKLPVI